MNILLVRPYPELKVARTLEQSFLHLEPLDLEIVAGGVPRDHKVTILDLSLERRPIEAFRQRLDLTRPDMVGFTAYSSHAHTVKRLAALVKDRCHAAITMVGGVHATIAPEDFSGTALDFVIRGEGGSIMPQLVEHIKAGRDPALRDRCLATRDPGFLERVQTPPPPYPAVEDVPAPRRDLVDRSRYFCVWTDSPTGRLPTIFPRVASVRSSTGCAFNCSFCVVPYIMNGRYVQKNPEQVVDTIAGLAEDHVYFVDDEMFLNPRRAGRIAELLLERGIQKRYISWARSDTIVKHPDCFRLWRRAGLATLYVGIEAMDNAQLNGYAKRTNADINRRAIALLREIGITLHASLMVNPDFSVDQFRRLERDIRALCPAEVTFTVMSPPPGTELWRQHRENFICDPYRFYDCMHTLLEPALPLKTFYAHFSRLTSVALRSNPLRVHRVRVPFRDLARVIIQGTRYIFALRAIYRDYDHYDQYCTNHSGRYRAAVE